MIHEIRIPYMGDSVTSGLLAAWHVQDGATVQKDQLLYTLETDKISSEGTAEYSGRIEIKVAAGVQVAVGQMIAAIDTEPKDAKKNMPTAETIQQGVATEAYELTVCPPIDPVVAETPGTRKIERRLLSPIRRRIAQRLLQAQNQTASVTTFNEIDMSEVMALRSQCGEDFQKRHGVKLGLMSFFVKAAVRSLQMYPEANAYLEEDAVVFNYFYDISVAIASPKGLIVPVLHDCDQLSQAEIEKQLIEYRRQIESQTLPLHALTGGTMTITNGGVYGSLLSTPLLNPPQSTILGMHAIQERPVVRNGQICIRPMMYVALTYDHRLLDGQQSVNFLKTLKEALESPQTIWEG